MIKLIDTNRDFWREDRMVWMSPVAEAPTTPEAPATPEEQPAAEKLEAKKDEFRGKVAGAQQLIEDVKNIYVDEDEGVDKKAETNDQAVTDLYNNLNSSLGEITSKFETESTNQDKQTEEAISNLDAQLVGEVLTAIGFSTPPTDKTLNAGIKEKAAVAAEVTDVATLEKDIQNYGAEHQKDIDAFRHAKFTLTSLQNTFELIKIAYPSKAGLDKIEALLTVFKDNDDYKKGTKAESLDPVKLDETTKKLDKDFKKTVIEVTGDSESVMQEKIKDALAKRFEAKGKELANELMEKKIVTLTSQDLEAMVPIKLDGLNLQMTFKIEENADKKTFMVIDPGQTTFLQTYDSHGAFLGEHPDLPIPAEGKSIAIDRNLIVPQFGPFLMFGISNLSYKEIVSNNNGKVTFSRTDLNYTDNAGKVVALRVPLDDKDLVEPRSGNLNWRDFSAGDVTVPQEDASGTAETTRKIPEYQRKSAEELLAKKGLPAQPVNVDGAKVLGPEKMTEYGISDASGYVIKSHIEQNEAAKEAYLVMDYSGATFTQEFADQEAFKKKYPDVQLPEKGKTLNKNGDVKFLSPNKPAPFGGIRRQRDLEISVDDKGKITVKVSNILFGEPPKPEVWVPLRKDIKDVTKVEDVLYPQGYAPSDGGNGTESDSSEAAAEKGEELKSLEEYTKMLGDLHKQAEKLPKIDREDPRYFDVPKFLLNASITARDTVDSPIKATARLIKEARDSGNPTDTKKLQEIAKNIAEIPKIIDQASDTWAIREFEKIQRNGLAYGRPNGKDPNAFKSDFAEANSVLTSSKKFDDTVVSGAKIMMKGSGDQKYISGHLDLQVKGYNGSESVRFNFGRGIGPMDNWESLVERAMRELVENKDVRKGVKEQRKEVDDRESRIAFVRDREIGHLEKRLALRNKSEGDYDVFRYPDYEGKNEADVVAKIEEDFGNPREYFIQMDEDGDVLAVRQAPRGADVIPSGNYGIAAGKVEPEVKPDALSEKGDDTLPEAEVEEEETDEKRVGPVEPDDNPEEPLVKAIDTQTSQVAQKDAPKSAEVAKSPIDSLVERCSSEALATTTPEQDLALEAELEKALAANGDKPDVFNRISDARGNLLKKHPEYITVDVDPQATVVMAKPEFDGLKYDTEKGALRNSAGDYLMVLSRGEEMSITVQDGALAIFIQSAGKTYSVVGNNLSKIETEFKNAFNGSSEPMAEATPPQEIADLLAKYQDNGWVSKSTFFSPPLGPNEIAVSMNIRGPDPVFKYENGQFIPVNYSGSYQPMTVGEFDNFVQSADHRRAAS